MEPPKGKMRFSKDTGLRKLMRALRQGRVPDERMVIIETAMKKAKDRCQKKAR